MTASTLLAASATPKFYNSTLSFINHGTSPVLKTNPRFQGKQHGSLARAGKVKSQTPKVEKQEKKKKPKGRAMKRLLYNRRFVTVANQRPGAKRRVFSPFLSAVIWCHPGDFLGFFFFSFFLFVTLDVD